MENIRDSLPECGVPSERDSVQTDFHSAEMQDKKTSAMLDVIVQQMRSPGRQKKRIST